MDRRATRVILAAGVALSALSLVVFQQPSLDPTAWLIWGRQLSHGSLHTLGGPSWKPLPVAFTTLFALAGSGAAPLLWLLVTRISGVAALMLAYGVTRRLGGRLEAWLAVGGVALAYEFLWNCARGDSEGFVVALVLAALALGLDGRHRAAFVFGALAALVRPEVAPLVTVHGLWLLRSAPRASTWALVAGAGAVVVAAWVLPEVAGSGQGLRAATRAHKPVAGSPGQSGFPLVATFAAAVVVLPWPVYSLAAARVVVAWRRRKDARADRAVLLIAAGATVLMVELAVLAELGFSGKPRYATLPGVGLAIVGALGFPGLVAALRARVPRAGLAALAVLALAGVGFSVGGGIGDAQRLVQDERVFGSELPGLIRAAGGATAIRACGRVGSGSFERQAVAYRLGLRQNEVVTRAPSAGTLISSRGGRLARTTTLPLRARRAHLELHASCA